MIAFMKDLTLKLFLMALSHHLGVLISLVIFQKQNITREKENNDRKRKLKKIYGWKQTLVILSVSTRAVKT